MYASHLVEYGVPTMTMRLENTDMDETETVLGVVKVPATPTDRDLYINVPKFDVTRRSDGGAKDPGGQPPMEGDIDSYKEDEYVKLTFEQNKFYDHIHKLTYIESHGQLTNPENIDQPTFQNTDIPKTCPICGREAAALVKTEYNSKTGGKISESTDACAVDPNNRGSWFGLSSEWSFVHGME
jgi:hypothetical protein